jgi:hypothetical protein
VREALKERSLILNQLCPHLAEPVSFLYPPAAPRVGAVVRRCRLRAVRPPRRPPRRPVTSAPQPNRGPAGCSPRCAASRSSEQSATTTGSWTTRGTR